MSKLLQRLKDPTRSGVYRTSDAAPLLVVAQENDLPLVRIPLPRSSDKQAILESIAKALEFPEWFGANWDALEDCLGDLSWRPPGSHVLLFDELAPGDELGILVDVLASVAEQWAARGVPFFAVLIDPQQRLPLAELFRQR